MTDILISFGIQNAATVMTVLVTFVGICALATSLVVEGLKSISSLNKLPTKLICYIVAICLTTPIFYAMMAWMEQPVEWFMVFASFLASFVVAKVSMNGWDDITELIGRMLKK